MDGESDRDADLLACAVPSCGSPNETATWKGPAMPGMESTPEMFDLRMSEANHPLFDSVKQFMDEEILPLTPEYLRMGEQRQDRWGYHPRQLEILEGLK